MKTNILYSVLFVVTFLPPTIVHARPSLSSIQQQINILQQQQEQINEQLAPPVSIVVDSVYHGWYGSDGSASVGRVFFVGELNGIISESRNFFVFDLSDVRRQLNLPEFSHGGVKIVSAELFLGSRTDEFRSTNSDTETYNLNRVLGQDRIHNMINGVSGVDIFTDLADGQGYGSFVASAATGSLTIPLSSWAIRDLTRKVNGITDGQIFPEFPDSRMFAIGGNISSLNNVTDDEFLFGASSNNAIGLILEIRIIKSEIDN